MLDPLPITYGILSSSRRRYGAARGVGGAAGECGGRKRHVSPRPRHRGLVPTEPARPLPARPDLRESTLKIHLQ